MAGMNRYAYLTTGMAVRALSGLSKARISVHGTEKIPDGSIIFAINHFTRIETLIVPSYIHEIIQRPVWSLADYTLFKGPLKNYFDKVGVVSTRDPDRDLLITRTLLNGTASWIIFPEGRMVKNKKIFHGGRFMIQTATGRHPPHTGAAALALRVEFYRQRLRAMFDTEPDEAARLEARFEITEIDSVFNVGTWIVPVNITYYPLRARENVLTRFAGWFSQDIRDVALDELITEGGVLLSETDVDIRFGDPIEILPYLDKPAFVRDIHDRHEIDFDAMRTPPRLFRKAARSIMHRYMTAIYGMTAVNHDHLFASMLRAIPRRSIDMDDLRRRVYLIASMDFAEMGYYRHRSLEEDQIHLLTDDRHGKFSEFLAIAQEKGVVHEFADGWRKNPDMFSHAMKYQAMRVENPIAVVANEVEPLTRLQNKIKWMSLMPRFWIRHKTVDALIRRAELEFEADFTQFYDEDESHPPDIGMPFMIKGETRDIGLLLIHGYMGAPADLRDLAEYLGKRGFQLYVPRLKGHGTSPEDLSQRSVEDWRNSVDAGYALLKNQCKRVLVGGFSTGAALALDLAHRTGAVAGVFAICPPRRLQDPSLKRNMAGDLWQRLRGWVLRDEQMEERFVPNAPENPATSYSRNPVTLIREIEKFAENLESKLPEIKIPALVVHSRQDPVVEHQSSRRIFERLGSADKQYVLFNFERHAIISGPGAERVFRVIGDFAESLMERGSG